MQLSDQLSQSQSTPRDTITRDAGRRALLAAFAGFFVEMFDIYLPVIVLGLAMSYFQPAALSAAMKTTLFYMTFALSLAGRPVGAVLSGHYGDRFGRRKATIVAIGGFAAITLLIGLLPGHATLGLASAAALTLLRFLDGVFIGGGYTSANPLAIEFAPKEKRGEWAAFIHTGFPLSLATMSLITTGLLQVLPAGSAESPYARWGWRIPFLFGATLSGGVALYYARRVPESTVWDVAAKATSPLKELLWARQFPLPHAGVRRHERRLVHAERGYFDSAGSADGVPAREQSHDYERATRS